MGRDDLFVNETAAQNTAVVIDLWFTIQHT
jgi:hypothetical protein